MLQKTSEFFRINGSFLYVNIAQKHKKRPDITLNLYFYPFKKFRY